MIDLVNVRKSLGNQLIFSNLDLKIERGEFLGIFGESGKGKTTLLNLIGALEVPDSGEVTILGENPRKPRIRRKLLRNELGFVFQNYALIDNLSVLENLKIALKYKKMGKKEEIHAIAKALEEVGLNNFEQKKIYTLSGGEQQRVSIARLLLKNPSIILADEPTGSLDQENRDKIISLLKELHQKGKTVVMVTHDKELATIFSRIIEL
ncbi:ABC transporter ATP-binding protein [Listeria kieliensis]